MSLAEATSWADLAHRIRQAGRLTLGWSEAVEAINTGGQDPTFARWARVHPGSHAEAEAMNRMLDADVLTSVRRLLARAPEPAVDGRPRRSQEPSAADLQAAARGDWRALR